MKPNKAYLWEVRKFTGSLPPLDPLPVVGTRAVVRQTGVPAEIVRTILPRLGFVHAGRGVWTRSLPPVWRRFVWWIQDFQPATWAGHVAVTALAPLVVLLPWFRTVPPVVVACYVAGLYGIKELRDAAAKIKAGTLHRADRQGITGFIDGLVDWGGPVAVAFTYAMAWAIEAIR